MGKKELIQLFGEQKVRTSWDPEKEKWFFSIVDVCGVLTDQPDEKHARNYWKVLKHRLKKEGNETVTNCNQLKLRAADGKMRLTDVADMEQMFRLIESIPSKKAEPFKQWMAEVLHETRHQTICLQQTGFRSCLRKRKIDNETDRSRSSDYSQGCD